MDAGFIQLKKVTKNSMAMRSNIRVFVFISVIISVTGCGREAPAIVPKPALAAPKLGLDFQKLWGAGQVEVSAYETMRVRGGLTQKGLATVTLRQQTFSEDDRVAVTGTKHAQTDQFPAMDLKWVERIGEGIAEMTTVAVTLAAIEGKPSGVAAKATFSSQSLDGQLFHQLLFDSTGVRSHQYSYFDGEADEQITLPYPADGVANEALWLWARGMGAPAFPAGGRKTVMLLPSLTAARNGHLPLVWAKGVLTRESVSPDKDRFAATTEAGAAENWEVESAEPHRVLEWESSNGERAHLVRPAQQNGEFTPHSREIP